MKKALMIALLAGMLTPSVHALEDFEILENVITAAKCQSVARAKFRTGHRYNQWVKIENVRQVSPVDFEFLIESNNGNSYQWISASLFKEVRCNAK